MPNKFTEKFKYMVDGSGRPAGTNLSGQMSLDLGQAPVFSEGPGLTFDPPQGVTGPDGTTAPRPDSVSYHILRNISDPESDSDYINANYNLEDSQKEKIRAAQSEALTEGLSPGEARNILGSIESILDETEEDLMEWGPQKDGKSAYLKWAVDVAPGAEPKITPVFPNLVANSGITEEPTPEECGDLISSYYEQEYQFGRGVSPVLNKGFPRLRLGYNPSAEWVLGVTQAGTVGATTGFTLGARCGQTQWWFEGGDGNTGNTAGITGEICQILDLTDVSGTTYVQGVGTISGGVYALFVKSVGPTGGTYGRGLTMFRPGTTGPEYLYDLGSSVTGSIQYAQSLFPASRCQTILNDLKLTASMMMLEHPVEITGGTGGTEDPLQHAFKARIKPREVNVILESLLARKQVLIDQKDVFTGPTGDVPVVEGGILGVPGSGASLPNTQVSIIPGTSTNSGANKANISAFDELVHGLYTIQNKIRIKFDRMFLGATGASLDTIYKIKHFLPKIEQRIQRVGPDHNGGTGDGGLPRTIWDAPPGFPNTGG